MIDYKALAERTAGSPGGSMETDDLIVLAREKALNYPMPAERYPGCERDHLHCLLRMLADRIEDLDSQLDTALDDCRRLAADKLRLDWLADPKNDIGQVLLPTWCVEQNPESMRAAIDAAMGEVQ